MVNTALRINGMDIEVLLSPIAGLYLGAAHSALHHWRGRLMPTSTCLLNRSSADCAVVSRHPGHAQRVQCLQLLHAAVGCQVLAHQFVGGLRRKQTREGDSDRNSCEVTHPVGSLPHEVYRT